MDTMSGVKKVIGEILKERSELLKRAKRGDPEAKRILREKYHLRFVPVEKYLEEKRAEQLLQEMKKVAISEELERLKEVAKQLAKLKKSWKEIVDEFSREIEHPKKIFLNGIKKLFLTEKYSRDGINFILQSLFKNENKREWMIQIISEVLIELNPWRTCKKEELRLWREFLNKLSGKELFLLFYHLFWDINVISRTFTKAFRGRRVRKTLEILLSSPSGIKEVRNLFLKRYLSEIIGKGKIKKRKRKIPKVEVKVIKKGSEEKYFFLGKYHTKPITGVVPKNVCGKVLTLLPDKFLKFYGWIFRAKHQNLRFFVREAKAEINFLIFRESQAIRDYILLNENERIPLLSFRKKVGGGKDFLIAVIHRKRVKVKLSSAEGKIVEMKPVRRNGVWVLEFYKVGVRREKLRSYELKRRYPYLKRVN